MRMTKLRVAVVSLLLIAGETVPWLIQRESKIKLQERINFLETQVEQLNQQRAEDERLSSQIAQSNADSLKESDELLKLRGEVGLLRSQTNELLKLRAENRQLKSGRYNCYTSR